MGHQNLKKTIYIPGSILLNPRLLLKDMFTDLCAARGLAWRLFIRNISARYRQSLLGYLWAFLPPIFTMGVWVFLNSQKIINIDDPGMPYPVFVLVGTVLWQTFVEAFNCPLKAVNESRALLAKVNFPREALILSGLAEILFNFSIRSVLLVAVFFWFKITVPSTVLLAFLGLISLIMLGLMVGLLLTPVGVLYSDVGVGMTILAQFWFFLTPVIYPMPQSGLAELFVSLNPVTAVLVTTREWLTTGQTSQFGAFCLVSFGSAVLLFFGWLLYRIAMPHLIARMSA